MTKNEDVKELTRNQQGKKGTGERETIKRNIARHKKTGKYIVTLYLGAELGKPQRTFKTCDTLKEAEALLKKHEYERTNLGKHSTNTQITIEECAKAYIENKPLAPTTIILQTLCDFRNIINAGQKRSRGYLWSHRRHKVAVFYDTFCTCQRRGIGFS